MELIIGSARMIISGRTVSIGSKQWVWYATCVSDLAVFVEGFDRKATLKLLLPFADWRCLFKAAASASTVVMLFSIIRFSAIVKVSVSFDDSSF